MKNSFWNTQTNSSWLIINPKKDSYLTFHNPKSLLICLFHPKINHLLFPYNTHPNLLIILHLNDFIQFEACLHQSQLKYLVTLWPAIFILLSQHYFPTMIIVIITSRIQFLHHYSMILILFYNRALDAHQIHINSCLRLRTLNNTNKQTSHKISRVRILKTSKSTSLSPRLSLTRWHHEPFLGHTSLWLLHYSIWWGNLAHIYLQ